MEASDKTQAGLKMTLNREIGKAGQVSIENPFSIHRAEHLGNELHRYFAKPELFSGRLSARSLVILGGRGCGKTMFFIYHTYRSKRQEYYSVANGKSDALQHASILGAYVHAKSDVVTAFKHRNLDEETWTRTFSHYFNLVVAEEIAHIAELVKKDYQLDTNLERDACEQARFVMAMQAQPSTYSDLARELRMGQLETLRYVGNPSRFPEPILTVCGQLPKILAEGLICDPILATKTIHVFVDEYENLLEYQQRVINTLVKSPSAQFVVDIGLRKEGWKTRATLAEGESISHPHDFSLFAYEVDLSAEEYAELASEACRKRFEVFGVPRGSQTFDSHSIRHYLGEYDLSEEVGHLLKDRDAARLPYKTRMRELLKSMIPNERDSAAAFKTLAHGDDEVVNRLNLCLLLQGKKPSMLMEELAKREAGLKNKYDEWLHNYDLGVVFLLCRDVGVNKRYWGFSAFCLLSSGTIRYFLELCENAFLIASRRNFDFRRPRRLTPLEQDGAAQAVSARKVEEVDSYTPHGVNLKTMVNVLGAVFESLHEDLKVSEPERNHFTTRAEALSNNAQSVIKSALLWNVLQARPITKAKAPSNIDLGIEYHLNHIYSPFFQISYRRKRSLYIAANVLEKILTGNMQTAKAAGRSLLLKRSIAPISQLDEDSSLRGVQTDLWVQRFEREQ